MPETKKRRGQRSQGQGTIKNKRQLQKEQRDWRFSSSSSSPRKKTRRVHFKPTSTSDGGIWRRVSSLWRTVSPQE
jgi:hypothetical protein